MLKLSYTNKLNHMRVVTENPNDQVRGFIHEQFAGAYQQGFQHFMTEVEHAIRRCKPGEKIVVRCIPLSAEVTKEAMKKVVKP